MRPKHVVLLQRLREAGREYLHDILACGGRFQCRLCKRYGRATRLTMLAGSSCIASAVIASGAAVPRSYCDHVRVFPWQGGGFVGFCGRRCGPMSDQEVRL